PLLHGLDYCSARPVVAGLEEELAQKLVVGDVPTTHTCRKLTQHNSLGQTPHNAPTPVSCCLTAQQEYTSCTSTSGLRVAGPAGPPQDCCLGHSSLQSHSF